jgi:hypothetical protein
MTTTTQTTTCEHCDQSIYWVPNSPYSSLGDWQTRPGASTACPDRPGAGRFAPHVPVS